ncbi:hypothetical protein [Lewinella sp. W8]|uniref:hypothetical protein n=1 Tax=Lewinella sp. W8 TaxID=2528208 RepID=UPI00106727DD|nr:hypothetical protein [Lewinella sp. W8]MTB50065.1 hypothetical protein [Lewinella sp. W8]
MSCDISNNCYTNLQENTRLSNSDKSSPSTTTPDKYNGGSHAEKPVQFIGVDKFVVTLQGVKLPDNVSDTFGGAISLTKDLTLSTGYEAANGRKVLGTRFYKLAFTIRHGTEYEPVAHLLYFSRDGAARSELTIRNHVLYRKGWTNTLTAILRALNAQIYCYTAIDIAVDGYGHLNTFSRVFKEDSVRNYGRGTMTAYFDSSGKNLAGVDLGVKTADNRITIYRKSEDYEKKPYIKDAHEAAGLDTSQPVDRTEGKYRRKFLARIGGMASEDDRAALEEAYEGIIKSKKARTKKKYAESKAIKQGRDREIKQVREDAKAAIAQVDYHSPEADAIRKDREDRIDAIRAKYRKRRNLLQKELREIKEEVEMGIVMIDDANNDLLTNGIFDYRRLEDPAVLADIHKKGANSLIKLRRQRSENETRPDQQEYINIIDYDALRALDIKLKKVAKAPSPVWGVQRKISFDMRNSFRELDMMQGETAFLEAMRESAALARKFGIADWFYKSLDKWEKDKEYHWAITSAMKSAEERKVYSVARLPGFIPPDYRMPSKPVDVSRINDLSTAINAA